MALLDELVGRVGDERLRTDLAGAVSRLRDGLKFGLVFEEHEPEVMPAPGEPLRAGGLAVDESGRVLTVTGLTPRGGELVAEVGGGGGGRP